MSFEKSLITGFLRKRAVFCASFAAAVASSFIVPPSSAYLSYIDWDTLFILFALMAAVSGLESCGIFGKLARAICSRAKSARSLSLVLVLMTFFFSMLVTNDVALLAFVPFSITLLSGRISAPRLAFVVVLQTVAANTGSMLTPVGNPQNLFIFNKTGMSALSFSALLLPYSALSLALLVSLVIAAIPRDKNSRRICSDACLSDVAPFERLAEFGGTFRVRRRLSLMYALLFALCILSVGRLVPKWVSALSVLALCAAFDRAAFRRVDWFLLLTFASFFVFSGNIASIPSLRAFLGESMRGNELLVSLAVSQVVSNVPATLMLYNFAADVEGLLLGVDFGGLGTLVASLASLISFNIFTARNGRALLFISMFTAVNVLFLAALLSARFVA